MTDMHDEVVEAVVEHYSHDKETAADCLVYLAQLKNMRLAVAATRELENMHKCPRCGGMLETYTHQVYHPEVDEPPMFETVTEVYCPGCDIRRGGYYV